MGLWEVCVVLKLLNFLSPHPIKIMFFKFLICTLAFFLWKRASVVKLNHLILHSWVFLLLKLPDLPRPVCTSAQVMCMLSFPFFLNPILTGQFVRKSPVICWKTIPLQPLIHNLVATGCRKWCTEICPSSSVSDVLRGPSSTQSQSSALSVPSLEGEGLDNLTNKPNNKGQ